MPYVPATQQLVVEIFVRDMQRAKTFYQQLDFELIEDRGDFVVLAWEDHLLFLDEQTSLPPLPDTPQANMRIIVPNVDDYWQRVNQMGLRVLVSIGDRDYGIRDFIVADPDGFGIRFGSFIK